jgi:hypothetical protein
VKLAAVALASTALLVGTARERPLLTGAAQETAPAAAGGWLAWTQGPTTPPSPYIPSGAVLLRRPDGRVRRIEPTGTVTGSGGLDRTTLVLQVVRGGASDVARVDLASGRLTRFGPGIDTRRWEWRPTISGHRLLFGRIDFETGAYEVVLADLRTGRTAVLARVAGHGAYAAPGQVNGDWAVWSTCPDNVCRVVRLRISTHRTVAAPPPHGYRNWQVAPSVARNGDVYYGVSYGCTSFRLVRWHGAAVTPVVRLPRGVAIGSTFVDDTAGGRARVLYDRVRCGRHERSDVYEVVP